MAHKHNIYDTDNHYTISAVTRAITNVSPIKVNIMQYDHNSERLTFELPRYIDDHDMSLCNSVQVHYLNTDGKNTTSDVYEVDDLQISPDGENVVICSWLISQNATRYAGSLSFLVRFACVSEDGTIDYAWNTDIYKNVSVSNGIYNSDIVVEQYSDILEKWKEELFSTGGGADIALGISGASAGQIARITAVDDAGVPTAWEAVELPDGGGSEWKLLRKFTLPDDPSADTSGITWVMCSTDGYTDQISSFEFDTDESGNTFALTELMVFCNHAYGSKMNYFSIANQDGSSAYGNLFCNRSIFGNKSALTPMVIHTKIENDIVLATLHTGDNLNGTGVLWTNFGKTNQQQLQNKIITAVKLGTFNDSSIKPGASYEIWGR